MGRKDDQLRIRCDESTATEFRRFAVGFDNQEEAIEALLREYKADAEKAGGRNFS
jgi:hypothetical protein